MLGQQRLVGGDHVLPLAMASSTSSRASVSPPISSTTMSMAGSRTSACTSVSTGSVSPTRERALATSRTAARVTSMRRPARRAISSALRDSTVQVPPPTTPRPSRPTLMGFIAAPRRAGVEGNSLYFQYAASWPPSPASLRWAARSRLCRSAAAPWGSAQRFGEPLLQQSVFTEHVLMPRTAWRVRCSFSIRAKRTYSSPYSPKPIPGKRPPSHPTGHAWRIPKNPSPL